MRTLLVGAVASLAAVAACRDMPTQPLGPDGRLAPLVPRRPSFDQDPAFGSLNSPNSGAWDGGSPSQWDGGVEPGFLADFPLPTIIIIRTSGTICQVPGILHGDNLCWGPAGTSDHQEAIGLIVDHPNAGSGVWFTTGEAPQTVVIRDHASGFRAGLNDPQPWGEYYWTCGRYAGNIPCWGFEGPSHLEFERPHVGLTLVASTMGPVDAGTPVAFTAGMERTSIDGRPVDFSFLQWRWVPDAGTDPETCALASGAGCTHVVRGDGTMFATAYVNGEQQQQSIHIALTPVPDTANKLRLAGVPNRVPVGGGDVTFTAFPQNPTPNWGVRGWLFLPDSGAPHSSAACPRESTLRSCVEPVTQSGTMRVFGFVPTMPNDSADYHVYVGDAGRLKVSGPGTFNAAAGPVTFTATGQGAQDFSVTGWNFHPTATSSSAARLTASSGTVRARLAPRTGSASRMVSSAATRALTHGTGVRVKARTASASLVPTTSRSITDAAGMTCAGGDTCTFLPPGAGYVVATAMVDGEEQVDSTYIAPELIHLKVTASPATVSAGADVTFTAEAETQPANVSIDRWMFVPDSATGAEVCSPSTTCVAPIAQSGDMWAFGTVNGIGDSASAHVTVTIAPPVDTGGCGTSLARRLAPGTTGGGLAPTSASRVCVPPDPSGAPVITGITPNPMVPGASAVITGKNFGATIAANTVTIAGLTAKVTAASTSQLTVVVPCALSATVDVVVTVGASASAPFPHPLAAVTRTLAVGTSLVLTSARESACNELPVPVAGGAPARYMVAIVNVDASAKTSTQFEVRADQAGSALAAGAPNQERAMSRPAAPARSIVEVIEDAAEARRVAVHERLLALHGKVLEAAAAASTAFNASPAPSSRAVVAATVPLTRAFRVGDLGQNACNDFFYVTGTRVYSNGKFAIYEDDALPAGLKAAQNPALAAYYTKIGDQYNADMEPIIRKNFGDVLVRDAVLDKNGILVALVTPRVNPSQAIGFASPCDQLPNDDVVKTYQAGGPYSGSTKSGPANYGSSNFGEFVYLTPPSSASAADVDEWYRTMRSTFIHEAKHVAALSARVVNHAKPEDSWLEEGLARTAEELWMRDAVDHVAWKGNTGYGSGTSINVFCDLRTAAPCNSGSRPARIMLRHFEILYRTLQAPGRFSPLGPATGDTQGHFYAEAWSLIRYSADRYAGTESAFLTALTQSKKSGVDNLKAVAGPGVKLAQLLGGRALSLAVDDDPNVASPSADIQFPTWNLRDIYQGWSADPLGGHSLAYPLVPVALSFGASATAAPATIAGGGAVWYELTGTQAAAQLITLQTPGGAALASNLRLAIARLQ